MIHLLVTKGMNHNFLPYISRREIYVHIKRFPFLVKLPNIANT